ncbi:MAG TPA: DNA repair protein RadA [Candidatus Eisenbacteria bacterium]|nr:DNA repair protein RadA [Candidatus Eisenbacteria bacterium]
MKSKTAFVCSACGHQSPKWLGQCPACSAWNTHEETDAPKASQVWRGDAALVRALGDIASEPLARYLSGIEEFDRVLGGGLVPGSLVLVAGDPGIGKSTLLLEAASAYAGRGLRVLYVSAEESERQLRFRSRRLGSIDESLRVISSTRLESVAKAVESTEMDVLIVDSVQTLHRDAATTAPGSAGQVRDNALYFMELAKRTHVPVLLVGHVTKEGTVAGPRTVEHLVDAVLYLEGDPFHPYRVLRAAKNRFGPTHEVGMFEMREQGLVEVSDPSEFLLQERGEEASGSVITVAMEGTRSVLLEVQALVAGAGYTAARRVAMGPDPKRVAVILAVLERRARLELSASEVFVNVAGGFRIAEPAADLALALAVASSYYDTPVDARWVAMGEIGLGGEVRRVSRLDLRLREAARLGFTTALVPHRDAAAADGSGLRILPVSRVTEALDVALGTARQAGRRHG